VFLSLIYREGEAYATLRLREEIYKRQEGLRASETLFIVPFSRDGLFVSREDIVAKISACRAATPAHTRVALVGLEGVRSVLVHRAYFKQQY
jgi:hypothetical protein